MEVKQAFEYFGMLEQQFWNNLDKTTIECITFHGQLQRDDMLLYGEFGFMLLGLKPCVLVEFCDPKTNVLYLETVIKPSLFVLKEKVLSAHIIKNKTTPESDLNGCILMYSKTANQLEAIMSTEKALIHEDTMAKILDYPGNLPSSEDEIQTMRSVIYFHDRPDNKGLIAITSFAIQDVEKENTIAHFKKYYATCKSNLDINLKIHIQ